MANHFLRQLFFGTSANVKTKDSDEKQPRFRPPPTAPPELLKRVTCYESSNKNMKFWWPSAPTTTTRPLSYIFIIIIIPSNSKVCCRLCHSLSIFMHRVQCHQHRRRHFCHPVSAITLAIGHCNRNSKLFIANRPNVRFCGNKKTQAEKHFNIHIHTYKYISIFKTTVYPSVGTTE